MKVWKRLSWLGYLLWAVFVNACNEWMVRPLLLDYSALGMIALVVLILLWLFSIPKSIRRRWIGFTLFSLLLGYGSGEAFGHVSVQSVSVVIVMALGLMLLTYIMTRVRAAKLFIAGLAIIVANLWLPLTLWPYLTHFRVAYQTLLPISSSDFPTVPLEVVNNADGGQSVVGLTNLNESPTSLTQEAQTADNSPDALENLLRNYNHRYALIKLDKSGGRFAFTPLTPKEALTVDPLPLVTTFFPTIAADWSIENQQVVQYMVPASSPRTMADMGMNPGNLTSSLIAMGQQTKSSELANWSSMLQPYGTAMQVTGLSITDGQLTGVWQGKKLNMSVAGDRVIGVGSFTGSHLHQALIEGSNVLEVVSLDKQSVVSVYRGDVWNPLSNDIVTGPVDASGRDVVFVNSSPATILEATTDSAWKVLYTAPNPSLRFEASIQYPKDKTPEIITDDPSLMRSSPTRYFSSYTYRDGQLVRNWRVYETNVVYVSPVQFSASGPTYIVAAIYGSGHVVLLARHWWPILPVAIVILAVVIVAGYGARLMGKRRPSQ